MKWCRVGAFALMMAVSAAWAQESAEGTAPSEADIKIRYGEQETRYEYRINGELVEVKIVPKVGPPYYLVPSEDDAFIRSDSSKIVAPRWKLFEW